MKTSGITNSAWEDWLSDVVMSADGMITVNELRKTFYAGAFAALTQVRDAPDAELRAAISILATECKAVLSKR